MVIVGLPLALLARWHPLMTSPDRYAVVFAFLGLAIFWFWVVTALLRDVGRMWRGKPPLVTSSGFLWLATMIVTVLAFAMPVRSTTSSSSSSSPATSYVVQSGDTLWSIAQNQLGDAHQWRDIINVNNGEAHGSDLKSAPQQLTAGWRLVLPPREDPEDSQLELPLDGANGAGTLTPRSSPPGSAHAAPPGSSNASGPGFAALPLALIAKRHRDHLQQNRLELPEEEIDDAIDQLRGYDPAQLAALRAEIGDLDAGLLVVPRLFKIADPPHPPSAPIVAVAIGVHEEATLVAFARPGSSLPLGLEGISLVERFAVLLDERGQCRIAATPQEALRALALRAVFDDVVIYLGKESDLDPDVRARCVALGDGPPRRGPDIEWEGRTWRFTCTVPTLAPFDPVPIVTSRRVLGERATVRVELLRAEPVVTGLCEPFAATLRRRCVELTAYLAVHQHEPVTGDRLRARVLGRGDDASLRTLSNTASAVRRSLGTVEGLTRLQPVSPAGLYQLHDVDSDLVAFHRLVASARDPEAEGVAALLEQALSLVHGEPLATALRGFEWFLAEGHLARLQRDGEWAALRLAAEARDAGNYDVAFWAIEQGRLLDPYSDVLEAALHRVPRLREFGSDGPGRTQHEPVGSR